MIRTLGTIAVLACLVGQSVRAPAQEGLIEPNRRERILLMKTGRVLKGTIRRVSTGYLVSSGNGYVVIPFNQVRFDADDLQEAYLRLRLLERDPTVASHLALAEWCLSHKLYHESSRELRDALKRDPPTRPCGTCFIASKRSTSRLSRNRKSLRRRKPD